MKQILAHKIIFGDKTYEMHIARLLDDGNVVFYPFKEEIPATVFVSGTILLTVDSDSESLKYEVVLP